MFSICASKINGVSFKRKNNKNVIFFIFQIYQDKYGLKFSSEIKVIFVFINNLQNISFEKKNSIRSRRLIYKCAQVFYVWTPTLGPDLQPKQVDGFWFEISQQIYLVQMGGNFMLYKHNDYFFYLQYEILKIKKSHFIAA